MPNSDRTMKNRSFNLKLGESHSNTKSVQGWGCISVGACLCGMCKSLDSVSSDSFEEDRNRDGWRERHKGMSRETSVSSIIFS